MDFHFSTRMRQFVPPLNFVTFLSLVAAGSILVSCSQGTGSKAGISKQPKATTSKTAESKPVENLLANPYQFQRPDHLMGLYMTAWVAGSGKARTKLLDKIKASGLNSVVIDVRDEGTNFWRMNIPDGDKAHATQLAVSDPVKVMKDLKAHGIYPIARIACFRDNFIPKAFPQRAVQNTNGTVWHDAGRYSWLDPYNKTNWKYIEKVCDVAIKDGFPEIQLDYIRFASEGKVGTAHFPSEGSYPDKSANKSDVIQAFANYIVSKVKPLGIPVSADVFGIISSSQSDQGIGQELIKIGKPLDALSPMVYPSHFHNGEYGIPYPNAAPYQIIRKSLDDYKRQLPGKAIRPWIQAFTLGVHGKPLVVYGPSQVSDEVRAVRDAGYHGFFLWNAQNKYDLATLTAAADAMKSAPKKP